MNIITISGRLTKDAELRYHNIGQESRPAANFTVAVDRHDKNKTTDFIPCTIWGKRAESLSNYLKKGTAVVLTGTLSISAKKDDAGNYRTYVNVLVSEFEFGQGSAKNGSANAADQVSQTPQQEPDGGFVDVPDGMDEELPFL